MHVRACVAADPRPGRDGPGRAPVSGAGTASTTPAGQRFAWMDTLRGLAVFLVIYSHAVFLSPIPAPEPLRVFDHVVTPFRIPGLMFLSGMLLPRSLAKPRRVYLRGKVNRIAWPYLVWSVILLAVMSFGSPGPNPLVELVMNPTSPMWYLAYLFVFYLVVMPFRPAQRTWLLVPAMVGLVVAGRATILDPTAPEQALTLHRVFFTFVCFLVGDLVARHQERWLPRLTSVRTACVLGVLALPAVAMSVAGYVVRYQPLYVVSTLAGIVAVIPLLVRLQGTAVGRFLAAQGRRSIVFYVIHWPVLLVAYHVAIVIGLRSGLTMTLFNLAAGVAAGFTMVWLTTRLPVLDLLFDLHPASLARQGPEGWSPSASRSSRRCPGRPPPRSPTASTGWRAAPPSSAEAALRGRSDGRRTDAAARGVSAAGRPARGRPGERAARARRRGRGRSRGRRPGRTSGGGRRRSAPRPPPRSPAARAARWARPSGSRTSSPGPSVSRSKVKPRSWSR